MDAEALNCGYSRHETAFFTSFRNGLQSYLFRLQTEGRGEALVHGRMVAVGPGSLLLYRPGDPYELRTAGADEAGVASVDYYMFCRGGWIDEWWQRSAKPQHARIDPDERILMLWRYIEFEKRRIREENRELTGYLLRSLCLCLERAATETGSRSGRPFTITRMKRYIEEHAAGTFRIEDVARHAGLSVSRAAHLFRESCGKTIVQYVLEIRLTMAAERMKYTSLTLDQIAEACGFGSYPYFHRAFKERYGMSPKAYRSGGPE